MCKCNPSIRTPICPNCYSEVVSTQDNNHGVTPQEQLVLGLLSQVWTNYTKLPKQHPNELQEFAASIHRLQDMMAVRIVRRDYPELWPTHDCGEDNAM